uniref:Threonine synthase n=1 Tax=Strigomonas oncopelti TaxID=5657 RepID=U5KLN9_STROO|nr:threonine synthase [Strigomonas oncopelti]
MSSASFSIIRVVGSAGDDVKDSVQTALELEVATLRLQQQLVICVDSEETILTTPVAKNYHLRYTWTSESTIEEVLDVVRFYLRGGDSEVVAGHFASTRGASERSNFLSVLRDGLGKDGGLYILKELPVLPRSQLRHFCKCRNLSYIEGAQIVIEQLVDRSMAPATLYPLLLRAYDEDRWSGKQDVCPVTPLFGRPADPSNAAEKWARDVSVMELFHGPTAAFKDFALQLFPQYFNAATEEEYKEAHAKDPSVERDRYIILAATSGDTGVAAISGFVNAGGKTKTMILYPMEGVSPVQRLQMLTYDDGVNVRVYGVNRSNFDFCQRTVKTVFSDEQLGRELLAHTPPLKLSSANSINWGRLVPQVVYYFWCYRHHVQHPPAGWIFGDPIDVVVPCGNFGNILAGYVAKLMGVPIRKLVVASNCNDVLFDFVRTGVYDIRTRALAVTASPSIDILKASNVERFLYLLGDGDAAMVADCMAKLETEGHFEITAAMKARMHDCFWAGRCDEADCAETIKEVYEASGRTRLLDPHTAVAVFVARQYRETEQLKEDLEANAPVPPLVVASTAHWAKFPEPVLQAIRGEKMSLSEVSADPAEAIGVVRRLFDAIVTEHTPVHPALAAMLVQAETQAKPPRAVDAEVPLIQKELEEFAMA